MRYGQFCPIAKAAEIVAERWTPLVVAEMLAGSVHFSDIRRGVPLMSQTLLSKRLKELERVGVAERRGANPRRPEWHLTQAGHALAPVIQHLGEWGLCHAQDPIQDGDLDVTILTWNIRRRVDPNVFGPHRVTVQFDFTDAPRAKRRWGNGLAELLFGVPIFNEQDFLAGLYPTRYWDLSEFVQDDFHLTHNFTLNIGLRYELPSPANGRVGNFDLNRAIVVTSYGANSVFHAGVKFDKRDWAPRLGFAWSLRNNTVVRGAFGMFYSAEANIFDDLGLNPPQLTFYSTNFNAGATPQPSQLISSGFPVALPSASATNINGPVKTTGPVRLIPRILEWNLSVQRQFAQNWTAQIGYVG